MFKNFQIFHLISAFEYLVTTGLMKNFGPSRSSHFPRVLHGDKRRIEDVRFSRTAAT